jgi:hypothetical protein
MGKEDEFWKEISGYNVVGFFYDIWKIWNIYQAEWWPNELADEEYKSDNLQYNTLGHWVDGRIVSLTKRLMFQILLFS